MLKYYLDKTGKVIKSILFPSSEFVDTEPREGSLNPITSGGVADAIGGIDDIEELIPESASAENQLATAADIGAIKNGGTLTSDTAITVPNNASSFCAITEAAGDITITVETAEGEVPNFAFTFTTVNDITISVEHDFGNQTDTLLYSVAGGNEAKAGKTYQLTCVGDCWTLAEFTSGS